VNVVQPLLSSTPPAKVRLLQLDRFAWLARSTPSEITVEPV
jgi:hypothetical protein